MTFYREGIYMKKTASKIIALLLLIAALIGIGYGGYRFYHFIIKDATQKIKSGIKRGVVGEVLNPLSWFKK